MCCLTCDESSSEEGQDRCINGSADGLLAMALNCDVVAPLFTIIDERVDLGRADDFDAGVGDAIVLLGSVGSLLGGFLELPLSGAMMFPTDRLEY